MTDNSASYENIFSEWLAKQVSPTQLSAIYSAFADINSFCLSRKILKQPLFETDDLVTISKVRETVESNKIFAFIYRKQKSTMTAAMQYYYRFIKEAKNNNSSIEAMWMSNDKSKSSEQETSSSNSLIDFLVANNISFIDNRQKNGCLWMIGGEELKEFADKCSTHGVTFHFKADGAKTTKHSPAWWTTDDLNSSTKIELTVPVADVDNIPVVSARSAFSQESESSDPEQIAKVESVVLDADISGVTYDILYNTLGLTMVATKALVQKCKRIVEIKGKLYHEDAFVDWDDGAKQMCLIMAKLMQKNNGYISADAVV